MTTKRDDVLRGIPRLPDGRIDGTRIPGAGKGWRVTTSDEVGRSFRGRSTVMWSIRDGLAEFLAAPARRPKIDGYATRAGSRTRWNNDAVITAVVGGTNSVDTIAFEAISEKYGVKCRTFVDAFRACAVPYSRLGHRDWRDFDIAALRDAYPGLDALALPEWVEEMFVEEAVDEDIARQHGDLAIEGPNDDAPALDEEIPF